MNSNVSHSIITMESDDLSKLVTEVKETIAVNTNFKQLSAADLWNIQRNMKTAQKVSRRRDPQSY
ncbi:hypothetical protein FRZ67_20695 [Panacibacter ginsenosidivorans]|uniref:Uncharacterized protein n=1 Tax=Panacibacter ginsenosidivorans TaxID=1813871 RepID=A0A5B8VF08_9BACT|nr:hypothetical protein [Panacibacter ginsenosidivorans]QEC69601.1 hypothetical protein FRZ67_20695 [Panacibacter ginsenosidivorans]